MAFADGIPGQDTFDKYYKNSSKYENSPRDGAISSDASLFHIKPAAPFQQYNLEHIDFFTRHSLNNLLQIHGFRESQCERYDIKWGGNC